MQLNNKFEKMKKFFAILLTLALLNPAPGYSMRSQGALTAPKRLGELEQELLVTSGGVTTDWAVSRSELRRQIIQGFDKKTKYYTNSVAVYNLSALLKQSLDQIPDEVIAKIREALEEAVASKRIKSGLAYDVAGTHILVHVTHNYDELNASIHKLMLDAVRAGLSTLQDQGLLKTRLSTLSDEELIRSLNIVANDDSKVERPAESVSVAIGVNAGVGAANIKLFREFASPGLTPLQKLGFSKSPGFRFRVKATKDILEGNYNGKEWEFEISHTQYDEKTEKLRLVDEKGKLIYEGTNESIFLLALASQPNDYQITAVYPIEGGGLPTNEPIATVVYQPVLGSNGQPLLNPIIIYRSQSGADAVGGIGNMINGVNFVPGGQNGDYFVATKPATLDQARRAPSEGISYFVNYGYQSRNDGEIPVEGVLDHVEMHKFGYFAQQELADQLAKIMATDKDAQPYLSPGAAERLVEHIRKEQNQHFVFAPKESESDPFLAEVQARIDNGELSIVTDDKADMGGQWGHTKVPEMFIAIYRATLMEAEEQGIIQYGNTIGFAGKHTQVKDKENVGVGDDGHILMLGDRSENGKEAHQLSFLAFTRTYLFAEMLGKKYYGIGQDFAGPEAKAAKKNPYFYAKLTDRFFELLEAVMPEIEKRQGSIEKMKQKWEAWKAGGAAQQQLSEPFSGNVSQQGIGSARYAFDPKTEKDFDIIAADKLGPAALNRIIKNAVYNALAAGKFFYGLVFEIWDLKAFDENGKIPFADIPKQYNDVRMLLEDAAKGKITRGDLDWVISEAYATGGFSVSVDTDRKRLEGIFRKAGLLPNTPDAYNEEGTIKSAYYPQTPEAAREFLEEGLKGRIVQADLDWIRTHVYSNGQLSDQLNDQEKARLEELLRKSGFVPAKRIFLDAQADQTEVIRYLADSDRFNVKHVWGKKVGGWDINQPQKFLDRPLLGASVTRLGILSGGEYLGKDDPVMVGHSDLMHYAHEFLRRVISVEQGDMNGSHWEGVMPSGLKYAVATSRSFPIIVGLRYTVSADGKKLTRVKDIYGEKSYDNIRREISRFNMWFDIVQMSQFAPHGTDARTVEAAYELAKILKRLNKANSPYLVENKRKERPKRFFADPAANHLDKLYKTVAALRSEVRAVREGEGNPFSGYASFGDQSSMLYRLPIEIHPQVSQGIVSGQPFSSVSFGRRSGQIAQATKKITTIKAPIASLNIGEASRDSHTVTEDTPDRRLAIWNNARATSSLLKGSNTMVQNLARDFFSVKTYFHKNYAYKSLSPRSEVRAAENESKKEKEFGDWNPIRKWNAFRDILIAESGFQKADDQGLKLLRPLPGARGEAYVFSFDPKLKTIEYGLESDEELNFVLIKELIGIFKGQTPSGVSVVGAIFYRGSWFLGPAYFDALLIPKLGKIELRQPRGHWDDTPGQDPWLNLLKEYSLADITDLKPYRKIAASKALFDNARLEEMRQLQPQLGEAARAVRREILGGNWKAELETEKAAGKLLADIAELLGQESMRDIEIFVAPSFPHLSAVRRRLQTLVTTGKIPEGRIRLGAQDVFLGDKGAFTSAVPIGQLKDQKIAYVILGHSEKRRGKSGPPESSESVNQKVHKVLAQGLTPVVAVGESLEEYLEGRTEEILEEQIEKSLAGVSPEDIGKIVLAYEPVWAIGTGKVATPLQADDAQRFIRYLILRKFGLAAASALRIQYGGSVKPGNVMDLIRQPNVDGGLIGGAALNPEDFFKLIKTVASYRSEVRTDDDLREAERWAQDPDLRRGIEDARKNASYGYGRTERKDLIRQAQEKGEPDVADALGKESRSEVRAKGQGEIFSRGNVFRGVERANPIEQPRRLPQEELLTLRRPSRDLPRVQPPSAINQKDQRVETYSKYTTEKKEKQGTFGIKHEGRQVYGEQTQKRFAGILTLPFVQGTHAKQRNGSMFKSQLFISDNLKSRSEVRADEFEEVFVLKIQAGEAEELPWKTMTRQESSEWQEIPLDPEAADEIKRFLNFGGLESRLGEIKISKLIRVLNPENYALQLEGSKGSYFFDLTGGQIDVFGYVAATAFGSSRIFFMTPVTVSNAQVSFEPNKGLVRITFSRSEVRLPADDSVAGAGIGQERVTVVSPEAFAKTTAEKVADEIRALQHDPARSVNIVFATGNTMKGFLDELSKQEGIDWKRVQAFHLDEYLGLATNSPYSFASFLNQHIFSKVPIPLGNIHYVNGANPQPVQYMKTLRELGGADIVLLGVGLDGHLAFNEPPHYSAFNTRMQVVKLEQSTIDANKDDYPGIVDNPNAITMGMADIFEGRHLFFFANKKTKAQIVQKALEGPVTEDVPASILQKHSNVTVVLDTDAASLLTSTSTLSKIETTPRSEVRAKGQEKGERLTGKEKSLNRITDYLLPFTFSRFPEFSRSEVPSAQAQPVVVDLPKLNVPEIRSEVRSAVLRTFTPHKNEALILDEDFFERGGALIARGLYPASPLVVLTSRSETRAQVEALNKQFPSQLPILVADSVKAARSELRKQIAQKISNNRVFTAGLYKERALLGEDYSYELWAELIRELGRPQVVIFQQRQIDQMAGNLGLAGVVAELVASLAPTKSA